MYNQRKLCVKCPVQLETRNLLTVSHMLKMYCVYYVAKVGLSMGNITLIFHLWYMWYHKPKTREIGLDLATVKIMQL